MRTADGVAASSRKRFAITSSSLGLTDVNYKRNLDIVQQDRDGVTQRRWSHARLSDQVRRRRVGQRERRERHRIRHPADPERPNPVLDNQ
jgi:hypothetical protein